MEYDSEEYYEGDDESIDEIIDDAVGWDEWYEESEPDTKAQPKPPAAVEQDIRRRPAPPQAVIADIYQKQDADDTTISAVDKIESLGDDDDIQFKHLIDQDDIDVKTETEDEEIEEALEFFKKSVTDSQKRRPVRRKRD